MNNKLSIIALAAGKGTRMKSNISKPLHKVGNLEIINHVVNTAKKLDMEEMSLVVSDKNKNEIENIIDEKNIKITIQKDRNGTGSAAKAGLNMISNRENNILIMYGDVPLIRSETYKNMLKYLKNDDNDIIVLGFYTEKITNAYGRLIIDKNNKLTKIVEYNDATIEERNNNLCNAGIYVIKNSILLESLLNSIDNKNASKEYYLTDIIEIAQKMNLKCSYCLADEDEVIGINSKEELARAEAIFQDKKRKEFMANGVTLIDPKSVFFSYDTEIENDVIIEPNVIIKADVKIRSGVNIRSFSYLEACQIMEGAIIGPFARIRPGTILKENSRVGNFCEIKKSVIGANTKVSHLTYLGDTQVGDNTNIGAGTITCNYDGYSKFETNIGNDSFIGSNTIIIAPVNIGNNSLTAAGSIITKNIEDNSVAISRVEQKNLPKAMINYRKKREK